METTIPPLPTLMALSSPKMTWIFQIHDAVEASFMMMNQVDSSSFDDDKKLKE